MNVRLASNQLTASPPTDQLTTSCLGQSLYTLVQAEPSAGDGSGGGGGRSVVRPRVVVVGGGRWSYFDEWSEVLLGGGVGHVGPTTLGNGHRYGTLASYVTLSTLYMRSQKQTSKTDRNYSRR